MDAVKNANSTSNIFVFIDSSPFVHSPRFGLRGISNNVQSGAMSIDFKCIGVKWMETDWPEFFCPNEKGGAIERSARRLFRAFHPGAEGLNLLKGKAED